MTGFNSKRKVALEKLDDDDAQGYIAQFEEALQKEYQRGYDAGKASQPAQEPVAWMHEWEDGERIPLMYSSDSGDNDEPVSVRPLVYGDTTPPQRPWVGLSDSQIEQVYYDAAKLHRGAPMPWGQVQFGNALQALVKEKNYD